MVAGSTFDESLVLQSLANEEEALNLRAFEASPVAAALHSFLTRDLGGGHALLFRSLAASARAESSEMAMPAGGCVSFSSAVDERQGQRGRAGAAAAGA